MWIQDEGLGLSARHTFRLRIARKNGGSLGMRSRGEEGVAGEGQEQSEGGGEGRGGGMLQWRRALQERDVWHGRRGGYRGCGTGQMSVPVGCSRGASEGDKGMGRRGRGYNRV